MKRHAPYVLLTGFLIVLDQLSKSMLVSKVAVFESVPVIRGFFSLTHVRNSGGIFGIFNASAHRWIPFVLTALTLVALSFVVAYFLRTPPSEKLLRTSLAIIMAGALGNLLDRVLRGYVVDFLDIHVRGFTWPTFNVADSCISVGAALLIFTFFVRRKPS